MKIKKELVSVRIPKKLNKTFTEHVASIGISKTAFILNLIYKELNKENVLHNLTDASNTKSAVQTKS